MVIDYLTQVKHNHNKTFVCFFIKYYKARATLVYQYYRGIQYKKC